MTAENLLSPGQHPRIEVPAKPGPAQGVFGSLVGGAGVEGLVAAVVGEDGSVSAAALVEALIEEVVAEGVGDWDAAFACAAFGFDVPGAAIPAAFDVD
jgi:hypothetical protein